MKPTYKKIEGQIKLKTAALLKSNQALEKSNQALEKSNQALEKSNQALEQEILKRKKVEKEILEIIQEEQKRFGTQLHDGLCQELTGILMFVTSITHKIKKENRIDVAELKKISDLLLGAVSQARNTAKGLYPGELEGESLLKSLEELASNSQDVSGISCQFLCPKPIIIHNNSIATQLYKIVQEGITNALKHGGKNLQSIKVSLIQHKDKIFLTIKDDGKGFSHKTNNSKGIGLKIMKYRAHLIDASFEMESNVPHGTILKCILEKGTTQLLIDE